MGKLSEEGYIEKIGEEQEGNRPSRSIFQITLQGEQEFKRLLRKIWQEIEFIPNAIDVGIFFMDALSLDEIDMYLQNRIQKLENIYKELRNHKDDSMARSICTNWKQNSIGR